MVIHIKGINKPTIFWLFQIYNPNLSVNLNCSEQCSIFHTISNMGPIKLAWVKTNSQFNYDSLRKIWSLHYQNPCWFLYIRSKNTNSCQLLKIHFMASLIYKSKKICFDFGPTKFKALCLLEWTTSEKHFFRAITIFNINNILGSETKNR